jgi:hypothetical protein
MEWRFAGRRTKLWVMDGSVLAPAMLCAVALHIVTIIFLLAYVAVNVYLIGYKNLSMKYVLRRIRFILRGGVIQARPASYWRHILD